MDESDCLSVKRLPWNFFKQICRSLRLRTIQSSPCAASTAVRRIPEYRMTNMRKVNSDLMGTSCFEMQPNK